MQYTELASEKKTNTNRSLLVLMAEKPETRFFHCVLTKYGFGYRQARKRGILSSHDIVCRYHLAKKICKDRPRDVWTSTVNFYLHKVSLYDKRNPAGQAKALQGRVWRTKKEGLAEGCTVKGKKEGSSGRVLKLFVAISYNKAVIACHPHENT